MFYVYCTCVYLQTPQTREARSSARSSSSRCKENIPPERVPTTRSPSRSREHSRKSENHKPGAFSRDRETNNSSALAPAAVKESGIKILLDRASRSEGHRTEGRRRRPSTSLSSSSKAGEDVSREVHTTTATGSTGRSTPEQYDDFLVAGSHDDRLPVTPTRVNPFLDLRERSGERLSMHGMFSDRHLLVRSFVYARVCRV